MHDWLIAINLTNEKAVQRKHQTEGADIENIFLESTSSTVGSSLEL